MKEENQTYEGKQFNLAELGNLDQAKSVESEDTSNPASAKKNKDQEDIFILEPIDLLSISILITPA